MNRYSTMELRSRLALALYALRLRAEQDRAQGAPALQPNQVLTGSGVLEPCEYGAMPWYMFGVTSYVWCSHCGRRTVEYATRAEAVDAWNRGNYED
jgi:hypothetical protein